MLNKQINKNIGSKVKNCSSQDRGKLLASFKIQIGEKRPAAKL